MTPLSIAYKSVTNLRNNMYDQGLLKSKKFDIPTIVVGNLSVGGTGKTPMIEYLIRLLSDNYQVAVLSRGYKRKEKGFLLADENSTSQLIGDEPFQYHSKFKNIYVAVDADRLNGIEQLLKLTPKPSVVLLDDAFQHRRLEGGYNILLTKHNNLYTKDLMLPAGNLRESAKGAKRADLITVTKCPTSLTEKQQANIIDELNPTNKQTVFFTKISYSDTIEGNSKIKIEHLKNCEILLFTGIADAKPLLEFLEEKQLQFKHIEFSDHCNYKALDIARIQKEFEQLLSKNKLILTTEKDYARCSTEFSTLYYLPIECEFVNHTQKFDQTVLNYVASAQKTALNKD